MVEFHEPQQRSTPKSGKRIGAGGSFFRADFFGFLWSYQLVAFSRAGLALESFELVIFGAKIDVPLFESWKDSVLSKIIEEELVLRERKSKETSLLSAHVLSH